MPEPRKFTRRSLEATYARYNRPELIHPDPLEFLSRYPNSADREIVALVASSLAYGRVRQILKSVSTVLEAVGSPREYVTSTSLAKMRRRLDGFKHRFTTGEELACLLFGAGRVIRDFGSIGEAFAVGLDDDAPTVQAALAGLTDKILGPTGAAGSSLLPDPRKGSACKRMNLMLRWMVRKDDVDPGGWDGVPASKLIVPLDTHMHRIAREHGLTARKAADMRTALEITEAFARFSPEDPVRYDFALTRPAIGGH